MKPAEVKHSSRVTIAHHSREEQKSRSAENNHMPYFCYFLFYSSQDERPATRRGRDKGKNDRRHHCGCRGDGGVVPMLHFNCSSLLFFICRALPVFTHRLPSVRPSIEAREMEKEDGNASLCTVRAKGEKETKRLQLSKRQQQTQTRKRNF
ncbi:hypothetical protein BKA80DRAFT_22340 [Phyllosticta citrichinensis]